MNTQRNRRFSNGCPVGRERAVRVSVGESLKSVCRLYVEQGSRGTLLRCGAKIPNPTDRLIDYGYFAAFHDKDGRLIAGKDYSSQKTTRIAPGESSSPSCWIYLPLSDIERVAFYQVSLIETARKLGAGPLSPQNTGSRKLGDKIGRGHELLRVEPTHWHGGRNCTR
jgi:hypothetical protein